MGTFAVTYALTLLLALLFIVSGGFLLMQSVAVTLPTSLLVAGGYFIGMALFLGVFRSLAMLVPVPYAMAAGLAVVVTVAAWAVYRQKSALSLRKLDWRFLLCFLVVCVLVFAHTLIKELPPMAHPLAVFDSFGSLHSGRYANLATYIVESKSIPVVNQNYAQSLLAAAMMILGVKSPFLALHIWLSLTKMIFWLTMYGFFRYMRMGQGKSGLAATLVYLGNTALSATFVLVNDSGYPALLFGYTDTLSAVASLPVLAVGLLAPRSGSSLRGARIVWTLAPPALIGLWWQMTAPQNALLLAPALLVLAVFTYGSGRRPTMATIASVFVLLAFFGLGATQGGMLTPKSLRSTVDIPGMMQTSDRPTTIHAMYPSVRFAAEGVVFYPSQLKAELASDAPITRDFIYAFETNLWHGIRTAFFPILGFILAGWLLYRRGVLNPSHLHEHADPLLRQLGMMWFVGLLIFVIGLSVAFPLSYHGYKWELARFLLLGYSSGMMLLALAIEKLEYSPWSAAVLWLFVFAFSVGTILYDGSLYLPGHLQAGSNGLTFVDRIYLLTEASGIVH